MRQDELTDIRDAILLKALPAVARRGWSLQPLAEAAARAGYGPEMALAVFPKGAPDAARHFSDWADREMLKTLQDTKIEDLRIRERIRAAVLVRLEILEPHREAVRQAIAYWFLPFHVLAGAGATWRTADRIWVWAGDTAQDYNRYTKRSLLCGVLGATALAWLDEGGSVSDVAAFLDRRIENVMQLGRLVSRLKGAEKPDGQAKKNRKTRDAGRRI